MAQTVRGVPRGYTQRPIEEGPADFFGGGDSPADFFGLTSEPMVDPTTKVEPGSIPRQEAIGPWNFFAGPENEKQPSYAVEPDLTGPQRVEHLAFDLRIVAALHSG